MTLVASGAATRSNFSDLLEPGFRDIYFEQYSQLPTMYDSIFNVSSSSRQQEYDSSVSGLGQLVATSEGAAVTYEEPIQGYDKTYVHTTFKKGFKVTREMYDDDLWGVMKKMPKALASATTRTVENTAGNIFDNAFDSGLGGDGKYLCDPSHPRSDGGIAQSNADDGALNETELEKTLLAMRKTLDDKGQKILIQPDTLLVSPDLEKEAHVILDSMGRTGTNYNEVNPYKGRLNIKVWDYMDDTQAWFVLDSGIQSLNFFWRDRPEFSQDESFDTDVALYKVRCRYSVGWSDWRGLYGKTGT